MSMTKPTTSAARGPARDFEKEAVTEGSRRYSYDFDDQVRRFALRRFERFLRAGPALELGCHEGGMSILLAEHYPDLTVVDAAANALLEARRALPESVQFVHGTFEEVALPRRYEAIFMINVLEHVDDAVAVLTRVREWLTDSGRLFLLVPNANAPSRQIAVRMGLITHNQAVTEVEARNGHRRTYALDTLGRDLRAGHLRVEDVGGLVFKGLANFQMDKALAAGIITQEYLEGCFELGNTYPDLCASLFAVCTR
jgi:2-polyprenyl-3-methyl-5-hydroxy-6-metoxy-1,4-benzoquinol methylase